MDDFPLFESDIKQWSMQGSSKKFIQANTICLVGFNSNNFRSVLLLMFSDT